jgi:hypothetical protein
MKGGNVCKLIGERSRQGTSAFILTAYKIFFSTSVSADKSYSGKSFEMLEADG